MDARDEIADGSGASGGARRASGVYSRLAALEMLLYPTRTAGPRLTGTVSAKIMSALSGAAPGPNRTIPRLSCR